MTYKKDKKVKKRKILSKKINLKLEILKKNLLYIKKLKLYQKKWKHHI